MPHRLILIIACLVALPSFAQETPQQPSWMPKSFPDTFDFVNLSIARISTDGKSVQFARPKIQTVTKTRTVSKTVMQPVTKTKTVTDGGEEKTITYTEVVPYTVQEEQMYSVRFPADSFRFDVAIDKTSALDLAGNAIDGAALAARLQQPAYVLAIEGAASNYKPIDPYYLSVMRPDTMVMFIPFGTIPAPKPVLAVPIAPAAPAPVPAPVPAAPAPAPVPVPAPQP